MQSVEIIDVDSDPEEARRAFWRRLVRFGLPAGGIVLVAAGLIATALYTNARNKADVLALSRDFIGALNARVHSEVRAYLETAEAAVSSLAAVVPPEAPFSQEGRALFERLARDLLRHHPQLASAYLGTDQGEFLMVRRNTEGTTDTKLIQQSPAGLRSTWTRRDGDGRVTAVEVNEDDRYDPRTRGWFQDARQEPGTAWSKVYIFFTDKAPGITASTALSPGRPSAGGAVVGADISLATLSGFLADLQEEARGILAIVNSDGQLVAFHEPDKVMLGSGDALRTRTVRELGSPTFVEAFDRLRVEGPGRSIIEIDGDRYVFGAASLKGAVSRDWWLMLLAPESAYLGFISANGRSGLIAASGIIALALLLAGLLAYQGMVAERRARTVRAEGERQEAQRRIFDELAGLTALADPDEEQDLRRASEILARAEGARRTSFWRIVGEDRLLCLDAFEAQTGGHTGGTAIQAADFAAIFARLADGQRLEIEEARSGPQLTYLRAVETTSLLSLPVTAGERVLGAVWIEDADPDAAVVADHSVAQMLATLLAPRLALMAAEPATAAARLPKAAVSAALVIPRGENGATASKQMFRKASLLDLRRHLTGDDSKAEMTGATLYRDASVLALKLLDDNALAARSAGGHDGAVIREVVSLFKEAADSLDVPYVKILTDQVLAVDGFEGDMAEAAARLVDVALTVRERCNAIFLASGIGPQFTLGLDSGTVFGSAVGFGDSPYNVWGEAVRVAITMADTADPGTIQVSEATYDLLRGDCIFRRRGAFYLGQLGEMATFTLRSRL